MNKFLVIYGKPRYLGIIEYDGDIANGTTVVAESHRGEEYAVVAGLLTDEQEAEYRKLRNATEHGDGSSKMTEPVVTDLKFVDFAAQSDIDANNGYREEEDSILKGAKELLKPHELDMKLIDAEYLRNKRKLFLYFSSEQRVDFRAYVRDLAREFKTRIELRQIGVRDEAKVIRGVGPCGRSCCCSYWLNQFAPIGIKMVKEQNLALNPSKISGICGRLMCCMCFEHNVYHEVWSKLPNPGSKIKTPNGNVIVTGVELQSNSVRCYIPGRGEIKIPVDKFNEFKETITSGGDWITEEEEHKESHVSPLASVGDYANIIDGIPARDSSQKAHSEQRKRRDSHPTAEQGEPAKNAEKSDKEKTERNRRRRRPRKPPTETVGAVEQDATAHDENGDNDVPRKPRRPRHRGKGHAARRGEQRPAQE